MKFKITYEDGKVEECHGFCIIEGHQFSIMTKAERKEFNACQLISILEKGVVVRAFTPISSGNGVLPLEVTILVSQEE